MSAAGSGDALREFYEKEGWERGASGQYRDTEAFVDLRPVTRRYRARIARRTLRLVRPPTGALLDIGCGGSPTPTGADSPATRVCLDVAGAALRGARDVLGDRSTYVRADVCRLPFADDTFARILCAHVVYHLPYRRQLRAVSEMHRVLAPGGRAVVVYARLDTLPLRLAHRRRPADEPADGSPGHPALPYHPVGVRTLCKALGTRGIPVEVGTWALFAAEVTRALVPDNVLGRATLALASITERLVPRLVLPLANYPMLIIGKDAR
ncbi:class I SAM-dependent methyltransferase [Virgisporangium aurantiacum]|uniref:Methyltransferase type 11 domain-containing protein n=1 Tax=Virgisporangium aurantiacum TaxID=175570 RepID=A0A8J3ZMR3_9ACTN|nr:class I SAM-dependent methyltransferase [Virgisporangium aurantiacum]GIJ64295.1 hypothetical protein Vau01_118110 [Virgisporangium aurantiacum]